MTDTHDWIHALRTSHDLLTGLLGGMSDDEVAGPSYDTEWTIADVASHLGSQAEIFELFLDAGLADGAAPGGEVFPSIWDRWNALPPAEQVAASIAANEAFLERVEALSEEQQGAFSLDLFGSPADLTGLASMRLGEHALHVWDVAVVLDGSATVAADAVALLIDTVGRTAARALKAVDGAGVVAVETSGPDRRFVVDLGAGRLLDDAEDAGADTGGDPVRMPAEAFLRLVYGRLDPEHTPAGVTDDERLTSLRAGFPGF